MSVLVSVLVSVFLFLFVLPYLNIIIMIMFREDNILVEGDDPSYSSIIDIEEKDTLYYERFYIKGKTTQ